MPEHGAPGRERFADLAAATGWAVRSRWWLLVGAALLVSLRATGHGHGDWDYFVDASRRLLGEHVAALPRAGGLHLYASYPDVVTGPVSLVLVRGAALAGFAGGYAAGVVASNLLVVAGLAALERAAERLGRARPETTLVGGLVVLASWSELAGYGHIDDAVALVAIAVACLAIVERRAIVLGAVLGLAVASKQWGIMFLPLAFAIPGRDRVRAAATAVAVGALAWLPFVIAAPGMLAQRGLVQVVADDSLFGVVDYPHLEGPGWVRGAQVAAGMVLVAVAVWRGRWPAAVLVAVASRVLLDPATWSYYTAGVVFGACIWDLLGTRRLLPLWTVGEFLLLSEATVLVTDPQLRGLLRVAACLAAFAPLVGPRLRSASPSVAATTA